MFETSLAFSRILFRETEREFFSGSKLYSLSPFDIISVTTKVAAMLEWKPVESVHFSQSFKMKNRTAALTNVTLLYIFAVVFLLW